MDQEGLEVVSEVAWVMEWTIIRTAKVSKEVLAQVEAEQVQNLIFRCLEIPVVAMSILAVDWTLEWEAVEVSSSYQQSIKTRHSVQWWVVVDNLEVLAFQVCTGSQ